MKNLNIKEKEKLINIMPSLKKETRMYLIRTLTIDFVCQLAVAENDDAVVEVILKRLQGEKKKDVVNNSYIKLAYACHFKIRLFVVKEADIEIVCKMAMTEVCYEVVEAIVQRFDEEKENNKLIECYEKLSTALHYLIRNFVAKEAPFEVVCKMALRNQMGSVLQSILEKLSISKDKLKTNSYNLHESVHVEVRELIAKEVDIEIVCKMALSEEYDCVLHIIRERLEENKDNEVVKNSCMDFINVDNYIISEFAVLNASIEQVCDIAINKYNAELDFALLTRLEENKDNEIVNSIYEDLSKSKYWVVRDFIAKEAPLELICKMATVEENEVVITSIYNRLKEQIGSDVFKKYCNEFSKAIFPVIRIFAVNEVSIDVIYEMINENQYNEVLHAILERLKSEEQNSDMVKKCYEKLIDINNIMVNVDTIKQAPIKTLCCIEIDFLLIRTVIERLKNIKEADFLKEHYNNIVLSKNEDIRKFAADELPIEYVCDLAMVETEGKVVYSILKRFKSNKCEDILKEHYKDFTKAKAASIREFVVDKLPIESVCDMAICEIENNVIVSILSRLKKEKYEDSLNEIYGRLLDAENDEIKAFAINTLPIEYVKKHITSIENVDILEQINQILN